MSVTSSEVGERVLESTLTVLSPFLEGIGTFTCVAENVVDTANSTAEVVVFCESLPHSHCTSVLLTHSITQSLGPFFQSNIFSFQFIVIFLHSSSIRTSCRHVALPLSIPPSLPLLALSYSAQPFIRDPPVDLTVNQSSPATFSCTAQGNPVPIISWTGPSANFTTEDSPGANFTVSSVLIIDSAVRALHEGVYTCSASNGVGPSPSSSATLTVQGTAGDTTHHTAPHVL